MFVKFVQRSYDRVVYSKLKKAAAIAMAKAADYQQKSLKAYRDEKSELGASYAELAGYWLDYGNAALKELSLTEPVSEPTFVDNVIYWVLCKKRPELEIPV